MKLNAKIFFLFATLVALDQFAKYIFFSSICNQNIAWSIPIAPAIFYFAWIVIIGFLIFLFFKANLYYQKIFLIAIFSGAISNIIDRFRLGCVIDYIDIKIWPVFNLADVYITIGVILILLSLRRNKNSRY
jgi:signal peptidase II